MLLATDLGDSLAVPHGRYTLPLVPVLLALLVLSAPLSRLVGGWLESAPLKTLGLLSYGIYLFHFPVMRYVDQVMTESGRDAAEQGLLFAVVTFALTLIAATVSFYLIERPVLKWVHRGSGAG
jgi:peptidoglycan/LPS O-acetylase OafA/YrhL